MNLVRKLFIGAALLGGAGWLFKMVAIPATDAAESDVLIVGVLWAVGMVGYLAAAALGVVLLLARAPVWIRAVAGIVAVPLAFAALNLFDVAVKSVYTADGWFRDELALVLAALLLVAVSVRMLPVGMRR